MHPWVRWYECRDMRLQLFIIVCFCIVISAQAGADVVYMNETRIASKSGPGVVVRVSSDDALMQQTDA